MLFNSGGVMSRPMSVVDESGSTTATVRLPVRTKEMWKRMADADGRTMGNYLERLLDRVDSNESVTMADLMEKMDVLKNLLKPKKTQRVKKPIESLYDMDITNDAGDELLSRESWVQWVDHLKSSGKPPNSYILGKHLKSIEELYNQDWDCSAIIKRIIANGHVSIYLPDKF